MTRDELAAELYVKCRFPAQGPGGGVGIVGLSPAEAFDAAEAFMRELLRRQNAPETPRAASPGRG